MAPPPIDDLLSNLVTRRRFLAGCASVPAAAFVVACTSVENAGEEIVVEPVNTSAPAATIDPSNTTLAPTPSCADDDDVTPDQTEGPFFTPDSPERATLREAGDTGTLLTVTGVVLSTGCQPIAGALLDFWQTDQSGEYDNEGYRFRGHQFTDEQGRYELQTFMPGQYTGRTRHIHVKAQAPDQPVLTTQLYFPEEPGNASDSIFNPALLMDVQDASGGKLASFDFVLDIS